jgi:hypothetical protein
MLLEGIEQINRVAVIEIDFISQPYSVIILYIIRWKTKLKKSDCSLTELSS